MRIFSLTDVATPQLEKAGMVNATFLIGKSIFHPGQHIEVGTPSDVDQATIQHLANKGALSVDALPSHYVLAKGKKQAFSK